MTTVAKSMEHLEIEKIVCEDAKSCDDGKLGGWTDQVNASSYKALRFCQSKVKGFGIIHEIVEWCNMMLNFCFFK